MILEREKKNFQLVSVLVYRRIHLVKYFFMKKQLFFLEHLPSHLNTSIHLKPLYVKFYIDNLDNAIRDKRIIYL